MNKLNVINRYLIDHDAFIFDGLNLVNNRSWLVKFFPILTSLEGTVRRVKTSIYINRVLHHVEALFVCYFVDDKVNSFNIIIENGFIRPSDGAHNADFDNKIDKLFEMICKFNTYNINSYDALVDEIKARRAKPAAKKKAVKRNKKPTYSVKPIKRK